MSPTPTALPIVFDESYEVDIGPHVFPTRKFRLIRDRLLAEGTILEGSIRRPTPAPDAALALVHTGEYLRKIESGSFSPLERLTLEVPFTPELATASINCAGGSTLIAELAIEVGIGMHLGGGFHHAFPDHGEGFCLINDVAVAVRSLQARGAIDRSIVLDCDVHHGNGTAAIFASDPSTFTFSMHQEHNYPALKPPSDLDLGLADGTGDEEYLGLLGEHLPAMLDRQEPELAFYLAGADPYRDDQLGGLALSLEGLAARDALVIGELRDRSIATAIVLAGGYARQPGDTVEIHCGTARAAAAAMAVG